MFQTISVIITTKNRAMDLRQTLRALRKLDPCPLEVLITADGCTDDTVEVVSAEFPQAILIINEVGRGSVASRDRMMRQTEADWVLSLDDDSYPEQTDCLVRMQVLFAENPQMGVLHFPQRSDQYPASLNQIDFGPPRLTRTYANSGAVLRRSTYMELAGYEKFFFHAYEEGDYALQCIGAGWQIVLSPEITIRHHFSGQARNKLRIHQLHARNEFWSTLLRCPMPYAALVLFYRVFSQFRYCARRDWRWLVREPIWWWQTLAGIPYCLKNRKSVSWASYRHWLSLS